MHNSTRSQINKAFRILRRNYGCPGNDSLSIKEIKESYDAYTNILLENLDNFSYDFEETPKSLLIHDLSDRERKIFVYNVLERWVQHYIKLQIVPLIESVLSEYVYAYRRGKTDTESYKYILRSNPKFVLRLDIRDYFRSIDRSCLFGLLEGIGVDEKLMRLTQNSLNHCNSGLPAGHVLSCTLSNLYLKDFDYKFPKNYTRYSDDMMFALHSKKDVHETIMSVSRLLLDYNLRLNTNKTRVVTDPILEKLL